MSAAQFEVLFGDERLPARFWSKVRVDESGCWIWTGGKIRGYGQFRLDGRTRGAHRIAYEVLVGPVPVGLELDHFACDRPTCIRPDHLRPVTARENVLRGDTITARNLAKSRCPRGHPYAGDNLRVRPNGGRDCRACQRERDRRKRAAQRAQLTVTT